MNLFEIVIHAVRVENAVTLRYLVALSARPQKIERVPQFQLVQEKLDDTDGETPLSEAICIGDHDDVASNAKHFLNDAGGIRDVVENAEFTNRVETLVAKGKSVAAGQ